MSSSRSQKLAVTTVAMERRAAGPPKSELNPDRAIWHLERSHLAPGICPSLGQLKSKFGNGLALGSSQGRLGAPWCFWPQIAFSICVRLLFFSDNLGEWPRRSAALAAWTWYHGQSWPYGPSCLGPLRITRWFGFNLKAAGMLGVARPLQGNLGVAGSPRNQTWATKSCRGHIAVARHASYRNQTGISMDRV